MAYAAPRLLQLVCEGACNPNYTVIREGMTRISSRTPRLTTPVFPGYLCKAMGKMKHTPHCFYEVTDKGHELWVCERCGSERVYGARA